MFILCGTVTFNQGRSFANVMPTPVLLSPLLIYLASVAGAIGLLLMMPQAARPLRLIGGVIGAATLGGLWLGIYLTYKDSYNIDMEAGALPFYYVFSFLAIGGGAMVIASRKPIHAALWFVMVILASAGLFLTLTAEFMAFAMVIIYGGAILVTYMFVLMLASYSGDQEQVEDLPDYDRQWRNPLAAVTCGFLLLAVLLVVAFEGGEANIPPGRRTDQQIIASTLTHRGQQRLAEQFSAATPSELTRINAMSGASEQLTNVERVGLDLFQSHPLGLELAGVILLVALVGAVVIAKTHVPPGPGSEDSPPSSLKPQTSSLTPPGAAAHG